MKRKKYTAMLLAGIIGVQICSGPVAHASDAEVPITDQSGIPEEYYETAEDLPEREAEPAGKASEESEISEGKENEQQLSEETTAAGETDVEAVSAENSEEEPSSGTDDNEEMHTASEPGQLDDADAAEEEPAAAEAEEAATEGGAADKDRTEEAATEAGATDKDRTEEAATEAGDPDKDNMEEEGKHTDADKDDLEEAGDFEDIDSDNPEEDDEAVQKGNEREADSGERTGEVEVQITNYLDYQDCNWTNLELTFGDENFRFSNRWERFVWLVNNKPVLWDTLKLKLKTKDGGDHEEYGHVKLVKVEDKKNDGWWEWNGAEWRWSKDSKGHPSISDIPVSLMEPNQKYFWFDFDNNVCIVVSFVYADGMHFIDIENADIHGEMNSEVNPTTSSEAPLNVSYIIIEDVDDPKDIEQSDYEIVLTEKEIIPKHIPLFVYFFPFLLFLI